MLKHWWWTLDKKIFLLLFLGISAFGKIQDVELLANSVNRVGEVVEAKGNVVVYSQDYFITADRAIYDEKNEVIELFGNVNSMRGSNETARAEYVRLDLKNKKENATANFMMDKDAELWMQNDESCSDEQYYRTKGSIVSSCNIQDPDWKIKFTSGKLNKQSKFLHLYNPVFYIWDVPVLYLPYFGVPMDKTRRTGLLPPEFGYSNKEGFYYKQPIYFAPYESWDFQIDPQIRTRRGVGAYGMLRFADSPYSYGEIRGGIFENDKNEQKRLELKNQTHTGFEFGYDRSRLVKYLVDGDFRENLWIDFKQVKDVEYFDLKGKGKVDHKTNALITSKFNYYITTDEHYFGTYMRYYIDSAKLNENNPFQNKDTVQEIPTLQYHKFTDSLIIPNLAYSLDARYHNYTRKLGVEANQYELDIPVTYSTPLLDDYLNFSFTENLYATHINYNSNYAYKDGEFKSVNSNNYINNYHMFSLFTDLAKPYESFYHTISFGVDYLIPGFQKGEIDDKLFKSYQYEYDQRSGKPSEYYYEDNFITKLSDEYTKSNMAAGFTQYFYDESGRKFLRHSLKQRYYIEGSELGSLDHRIDFYLKNGLNFGNRFEYSHKDKSFNKVLSYVRYANSQFNASIAHSYEYLKQNARPIKENFAILDLGVNIISNNRVFGRWEYDLQRSYTKKWRVGLTHTRKCWNYSLVYQEDIEPKTKSVASYEKGTKERGIYFFVNFYPFGGVGYDVSINSDYAGAQ